MWSDTGRLSRLKIWLRGPWPAAIVVAIITAATIGTVVLATNGVGCDVGIKLNSAKCKTSNTAVVLTTPSPAYTLPSPVYTYLSPSPPNPKEATPPNVFPPVASERGPPAPNAPSLVPNDPHTPYLFDTGTSGSFPPTYNVGSGGLPPQTMSFTCRLPVSAGGSGSGGFLVLPDGNFIPDPRSAVTITPPPGAPTPPQYGPGPGPAFFGLTYDRAVLKWLPVQWTAVTPDGKRYVFAWPGDDGMYVVDAASNARSEIGAGKHWIVLDVESTGVYATDQSGNPGLWFVPFSGDPRQITGEGYWQAVGGGAAYGATTSALPNGVPNTIVRLDLNASGASPQPWIQVAGAQVNVIGFDAQGNPLVTVFPMGTNGAYVPQELWDVRGLGKAEALVYNPGFNQPVIADSRGIWLSSGQYIWLVQPGSGAYLVANIGGVLGGGCS